MFVNVIVTKFTSDNACKVLKKCFYVVPLQSISKSTTKISETKIIEDYPKNCQKLLEIWDNIL